MTARAISIDGADWTYAPDLPPRGAERSQALLRAVVLDEVLGRAADGPMQTTTSVRGAIAKASGGGLVGVVGRPGQIFFGPAVALSPIDMAVQAKGFLPLELQAVAGPQPGYPDSFAAVDLGTIMLHRTPVTLSGRVVSRALGPLAGATVAINGVWPVQQRPMGAPVAANVLPALATLYADRPVGGTLRRRNLTNAPQVKTLQRAAPAGSQVIRLTDRLGLAAGQILMIAFPDQDRAESIVIASVSTASSDDQPADIELIFPVKRDHAAGTPAARAVPAAGGPANAITRAARRGDVSVWTAALAGIGPATTNIEITGGPAASEHHATRRYVATTNAEGHWRLPPIHRVAAVRLTASHAAIAVPPVRAATLVWNAAEQSEDFTVP
jgi:hypothetical protein